MSCTLIQVFRVTRAENPTEQDNLIERDRLKQEGWKFVAEGFDELPIAVGS